MKPKVSIGLPVYNGEKFLRNRLENLLSQTFTDFELIISNNASTDNTRSICEEYLKKDKRIRLFHQKKTIDAEKNFHFVLRQAIGDYFVWAAVDDILTIDFLQKHVDVLESNNNLVGSISKLKWFDELPQNFKNNTNDIKCRDDFNDTYVKPITGSFEQRVKCYFRFMQDMSVYAVYRTYALQKGIFPNQVFAFSATTILNALKYGDLHVVDEVLFYKYAGTAPRYYGKTMWENLRGKDLGILKILFPWMPFTFWSIKQLGMRIFLKNILFFIRLNKWGTRVILSELICMFRNKISHKVT